MLQEKRWMLWYQIPLMKFGILVPLTIASAVILKLLVLILLEEQYDHSALLPCNLMFHNGMV